MNLIPAKRIKPAQKNPKIDEEYYWDNAREGSVKQWNQSIFHIGPKLGDNLNFFFAQLLKDALLRNVQVFLRFAPRLGIVEEAKQGKARELLIHASFA